MHFHLNSFYGKPTCSLDRFHEKSSFVIHCFEIHVFTVDNYFSNYLICCIMLPADRYFVMLCNLFIEAMFFLCNLFGNFNLTEFVRLSCFVSLLTFGMSFDLIWLWLDANSANNCIMQMVYFLNHSEFLTCGCGIAVFISFWIIMKVFLQIV